MMTREEVLAEMESSYAEMTPEEQNSVVTADDNGKEYTPTMLLQEVRGDTEVGKLYVQAWSQNKDARADMEKIIAALMGGGPVPPGMGVKVLSLDELEEMLGEDPEGEFEEATADDLCGDPNCGHHHKN